MPSEIVSRLDEYIPLKPVRAQTLALAACLAGKSHPEGEKGLASESLSFHEDLKRRRLAVSAFFKACGVSFGVD